MSVGVQFKHVLAGGQAMSRTADGPMEAEGSGDLPTCSDNVVLLDFWGHWVARGGGWPGGPEVQWGARGTVLLVFEVGGSWRDPCDKVFLGKGA